MEDAIVLYASVVHLNSILVLATFIAKHYPFLRIIIISYAPESAAASVSTVPTITYRRLSALALPPNLTDNNNNPVELFYEIPRLNNQILRAALQEISGDSRIRAVVIDFFCNAAFEVSTSLQLPTYFYVSAGSAFVCMLLYIPAIDETISADIGDLHDFLDIPGCPTILSSDLPELVFFRRSNVYRHVLDTARNMRKSSGILTNGFDAIDFRAKEALTHGLCVPDGPTPPVYLVGPLVGECNSSVEHECLRWLDNQPSKSVIFLCFGRDGLLSLEQLREVAVGLEKCGYRFLWKATAGEVELPEGFLERTKERGLVVKSWVPQKEVLSHDAVAGFVTHCGRSSVLEALCSGVPMIGWPLYAEQRMNRVVMVEEMKVALPLEEQANGFVTAVELEKRIRELMESNKGREIRRRVAEFKISAAAATATVRENGSSVVALHKFIDSLTRH